MQHRLLVLLLVLFLGLAAFTQVRSDDEPSTGDIDTAKTDAEVQSQGTDVYDTFNSEQRAALQAQSEKHEFQAEVSRLMDIIINSLYSNREIFLRELISNAADALDKIRYLSLTDPSQLSTGSTLDIKISFDKDHKTLTITDTGVGMNKTQLIQNLGIVARSGTTEFLKASQSGTDALNLIGQFGVGFYSVYLVADRVTVASKANGDDQHVWESTAQSTFTIAKDPRGDTLGRGTQIVLHLKEDALEFTNEATLERIIAKYSEFINFPIYLQVSKEVEKEVPTEEENKDDKKDEDVSVSDEEDDTKDKSKTKKIKEWIKEWKRMNEAKAIWTRPAKDVTDEEYADFYKALTKDQDGHLSKVHFTAEGEITFKSILYIPKKSPTGLYDRFYDKSTSLKLYVRRVLISEEFDDFLPRYLNFIRGVVDSEDLPLNVSRETLAQSKVLKVMGKKITRKVLELLVKMAQDSKKAEKDDDEQTEVSDAEKEDDKKENQYDIFWKQFGKSIKLGVMDDKANKSKLQKLLRYQTSKSDGAFISLEEYVDRMKENQKAIYYITGESLEAVKNSPFLETLIAKDYEVVYMTDPLDEYVTQQMSEFENTPLQSVTREGLNIEGEKKNLLEKQRKEFKPLTDWMKKQLGDKVEKVVVSNRIAKSPCVLVAAQYGWSANMERIMRAQTFANPDQGAFLYARKTMEINPRHPIIKELLNKVKAESSETQLTDLVTLLYDGALLTSGYTMKEPADFATRLNRVIANGLNVDPDAPIDAEPEQDIEDEKPAETVSEDDIKDDEPAASTTATETTHDEL